MNDDLTKFINYSVSQKEVSLIVTKDEEEAQRTVKTLTNVGYSQVSEIKEILKLITRPAKILVVLNNDFPKEIYDFVVQYPTGQVEIYDKEKLKSEAVTPIYKDVSIILIADKKTIEKSKLPILEKLGLTYRSSL